MVEAGFPDYTPLPDSVLGGFVRRCEILTLLHGHEFKDAYKEDTMLREQSNWKVLDYSATYARGYYVDEQGGDILEFTRQGDQWAFAKWETIWSKTGSADEIMWPYIR